jgi:DNA-binding transcriptional MerR regulator
MRLSALRVGQLAKRTGISVRTLHYYDEIGLLSPSLRTASSYRLYTARDVARLQQIRSLQQLGLSLAEVRACLDRPDSSLLRAIELQADRLTEQIALQQRLLERLHAIAARLRSAEDVSVEELMQTMEDMHSMDRYYTPEQQEYLRQRAELVGVERMRQVETAEWPRLIAEVREALDSGVDPASEQAQALARRWQALVDEFTGGDPGIQQSLNKMYQQEQPQDIHPAMDPRMREYGEYMRKAMANM